MIKLTSSEIDQLAHACLAEVKFYLAIASKIYGLDSTEIYDAIALKLLVSFKDSIVEVMYGTE